MPQGPFDIAVLSTPNQLAELKPEWDSLHARSVGRFPYTRHEWITRCWSRQQRQDRGSRLHLVAVRKAGQLVAVVPLRSLPGLLGLRLLTWVHSRTPFYSDLLREDSPDGVAAIESAADMLRSDRRILRFKFENVPENAAALPFLAILGAHPGESQLVGTLDLSPFADDESFVAGQPFNMRRDYRTTFRRLSELGAVEIVRLTEAKELADAITWLFLTKADRLQKDGRLYGWFADPQTVQFFVQAAQDGAHNGSCRVYAIKLDGQLIAVEQVFCSDDTCYLSKSALDPAYPRLSIGTMMRMRVMMAMMADGFRTVDFMFGEYPWKARMRTGTHTAATWRCWGHLMRQLGAGRTAGGSGA